MSEYVIESERKRWEDVGRGEMERESTDLAEAVEGAVEEDEDCSTGHLGDVVERLTGIVADPGIRVIKAGQDRLDQFRQVHPDTGLCGQ